MGLGLVILYWDLLSCTGTCYLVLGLVDGVLAILVDAYSVRPLRSEV